MSIPLNPFDFPLWGSRLIEASAGTGKTWTIAALYLRLILGHGNVNGFPRPLQPSEILVMTFTRAATRDLSNRIRDRLLEAAQCFKGEASPKPGDDFLIDLLAAHEKGDAHQHAAWRLATAAEAMDDASVHTLDAWCQRMLREHAFDSGSLFDEALEANEQAIRQEAAEDYWRQHLYPLDAKDLALALQAWSSVEALANDVDQILKHPLPEEAGQGDLQACIAASRQAHEQALLTLASGWPARAVAMLQWLDGQIEGYADQWNKALLRRDRYAAWLKTLECWASAPLAGPLVLTQSAIERLRPEGIKAARRKAATAIDLPDDFQAFAEMIDAYSVLPDPTVALRLHAAARVGERLALLKERGGIFGFQDLQVRLDRALAGPTGMALRARILGQYPVALVDEFQDTSPLQYRLLDQIYHVSSNDPTSALLMIGDPKQAIYSFRGADIHAYLAARRATSDRHYVLGTNFRSTLALVHAVNQWFERAEGRNSGGAFLYREAEADPLPFQSVKAKGRDAAFVTHYGDANGDGPAAAFDLCYDLATRNANDAQRYFAAHCAERIVRWLNHPGTGFVESAKPFVRLRPADIAVLVRTGKEAQAVRRALRVRGVASVYLSDKDSVFASQEAMDLLYWLRAVASPLDARIVRAGLATRTIGLSLAQLQWLATSDEAFDVRSAQLRQLQSAWQTHGVLTMLRQTLHVLDLPARWLQTPDGERRLTNFLHLAELLQNASARLEGEMALVRWLGQQLGGNEANGDEQVVRLESDADLVKVITIHKSKGLEFPVVCLPFGTSFRKVQRKNMPFIALPDERGQVRPVFNYKESDLAAADLDRLREDIRLLYVALTRPSYALWMGFASLKVGNSERCQVQDSAAGKLLGGPAAVAEDWLPLLQDLVATVGNAASMVLTPVSEPAACTPLQPRDAAPPLTNPPAYAGEFDRRWAIGSFSGLLKALGSGASPLALLHPARPADDESLALVPASDSSAPAQQGRDDTSEAALIPDFAGQMSQAHQAPGSGAKLAVWHTFKRGALVGNFLHDQLQWMAGEGFDLASNGMAERLRRRCERAGYGDRSDAVVEWLSALVATPLAALGTSLQGIDFLLPEMEFWLPVAALEAGAVDTLCRQYIFQGLDRPALPARRLQGMLMGFSDLVFEHQGRFWVLDYKSNHLGDGPAAYTEDALKATMVHHRYDVQAALYQLALHRLLKARLGATYVPAQHLGGAIYLFLRGIDGPEKGGLMVPGNFALMVGLEAMLDHQEALP
jgi:exodeoxyribonuclease V beta subunit